MLRRFSPLVLAMQFAADMALTLLALKVAEEMRRHLVTHLEVRGDIFVVVQLRWYVLVFALWAFFFLLLGVYDARRRTSPAADLGSLWLATTVSMLVLASLFYFLAPPPIDEPSRLFYAYFYVVDLVLMSVAHVSVYQTLRLLWRRGRHLRRVLLVGDGVQGRHVAVRLRGQESAGIVLAGYLGGGEEALPAMSRLGDFCDLLAVVREHRIDEVVIAVPAAAHNEVLQMTAALQDAEVNVRILPDVFEMMAMKAQVEDFYGLPLISIAEPSINPVQARIKRAFDIVVASLVLVAVSPILAITALWVRLDSPGPILIHQRRVGAGGRPFFMHKFRSMYWNPEELDRGGLKQPGDPRVTGAGRVLRRSSLDELPQLWNVLKGEMSIVGPRPELPAIVDLYEPWQRKRFAVPPGMTGWWQVNGRAELSMQNNTEIDLYYVQNYSILLDLQILARTLGAVIKGRGAY